MLQPRSWSTSDRCYRDGEKLRIITRWEPMFLRWRNDVGPIWKEDERRRFKYWGLKWNLTNIYIFQWFTEKIRKGFWHWKWRITFLLVFSNLPWRFAEVFDVEFRSAAGDLHQLQLKALSLCEGCHYQRSWHVELRFGRPESHLRWALKTAEFRKGRFLFGDRRKTARQGNLGFINNAQNHMKSLHLEEIGKSDDVSQWNVLNSISLDVFLFEVPNSGQNPGKNQQDGGSLLTSLLKRSSHGTVWRTAAAPWMTSCLMGWPLSLRSSLHLVIKMAMREVEAEEKTPKNPFFVLQSQIQIKKWESSSKAFWNVLPFGSFYCDGVEGVVNFDVNSMGWHLRWVVKQICWVDLKFHWFGYWFYCTRSTTRYYLLDN